MNDNRIYADVPAPASPGAPQNTQPPVYPVSAPAEPYRFTPPKPREAVPAVPLDGGIALACYAAGWCFLRLVWPGYLGLGMLLFTVAFAGMALFYRHGAGQPVPRGSYGWLLMMLLSAGSFVVLDNGLLSWLNLLFLMVAAVYWVAALFGTRMEGQLGERLGVDLANHLFVVPFQNFGCFAAVLRSTLSRTRLGKNVGIGLLSLLCSFPLLWFVCRELSAVTAGFGVALEQLGQLVSIRSIFSATTLLAVPTACYLFGLLYGCRRRRYTGTFTQEGLEAAARRRRFLPPVAAYTLLTVLCLIYVLFFVIGAAELVSLPHGGEMTPYDYSQFARKGFFELCRVSVVNLLVLWALRLFLNNDSQRSTAATRIFHSLLCCQTLLLIALALCKMGLYIRFCGITWLRVCTTWFMLLLAVVFGLSLLAQFRPIPLARWTAAAFCVLFLLLCWLDVDGLVVKNAVWRYRQLGDAGAISYGALVEHSVAGAPALYQLWREEKETPDSPVLPVLEELLKTAARFADGGVGSSLGHFNLQRARAGRLCQDFLSQLPPEQLW